MSPQVDAEHPWPGPLAFTEADLEFFFGRHAETETLLSLVLNHRLTVLYGLSGLGKTSLLRAGLFPLLRRRGFLPVRVRFDVEIGALSPSAQILSALVDEFIYQRVDAPQPELGEPVWDYLHRVDVEFWSSRNRPIIPLIVFDQFEEIFSRVSEAVTRDLQTRMIETVGDLSEGRVPSALKSQLERDDTLAARFLFSDHRYRLLIAIREDYLADLDDLIGEIPSLRRSRMRLTNMRSRTATAAVIEAGRPARIVSKEVAGEIVRFVGESAISTGSKQSQFDLPIEPALLSVVCQELNKERIRQGRASITLSQLNQTGAILSKFYEDGLQHTPEPLRRFLEDRLITGDGIREILSYETIASVAGVTAADIAHLIDQRILRIEYREGRRLIELTHDRLAPIVRESRDRRIHDEQTLREGNQDSALERSERSADHAAATELRQMAALLEGLRALGSGRVLDEVLALVLDSAIEVSGAERGFIMLANREGLLEFKLARAINKVTLSARTFEVSARVVEQVFATGRPHVVFRETEGNISSDLEYEFDGVPVTYVAAVPLRLLRYDQPTGQQGADDIVGVIYLDGRAHAAQPSPKTQSTLETLADQAALAIENARLYAESLEKAKLEQELKVAAAIQQSLLPQLRRDGPFFSFAAFSVASRAVGGDFFDWLDLANGDFAFILGDVAGRGSPAALLAASVLGMFAAETAHTNSPSALVTRMNQYLFRRAIEARFLTAFYATLTSRGKLTYSNAGHNAPMLLGRSGQRRLEVGGVVLGLFEHATFEEESIQLQPGDLVIVFSDGVTEALNAAGDEFTDDRVLKTVASQRGATPQAILDAVLSGVRDFVGGEAQSDDLTIAIVQYQGASGTEERY